jgi:hypothetical protein
MGNSYSDMNPFSSGKHIPKHLKPSKRKKKPLTKPTSIKEDVKLSDRNLAPKKAVIFQLPSAATNAASTSRLLSGDDDDELAEEGTALVGSGPRGAFRWFKGRRYLNYAQEVWF